jgi:hypothetical protein
MRLFKHPVGIPYVVNLDNYIPRNHIVHEDRQIEKGLPVYRFNLLPGLQDMLFMAGVIICNELILFVPENAENILFIIIDHDLGYQMLIAGIEIFKLV